ncbi:hypothetical protein [Gimesia algae]|uniref:ABC transmembrane type-1 domain-containing protein n=1 Tax=Gimesia algae TaxID=2527971 RepID=A0A517V7A0_9PLAN|nr:hypothetical protein [Gimesia algae]QDT88883.1 hypothetical protein Pan161_05020 [Gimesia algae]
MSLTTICGVTVLRCLIISLTGVFLCQRLSALLDQSESRFTFFLWLLILSPLLVPELIVGYAWSLLTTQLIHFPILAEFVYSSLVLLRVVPVGIICYHMTARTQISSESDFIRRSASIAGTGISHISVMWGFFLRKTLVRILPVWSLLFLLVFQEFEIASLLYQNSWTVWIFDAQAGGVPVRETLVYLIGPLIIEIMLMAGVLALLRNLEQRPHYLQQYSGSKVNRLRHLFAGSYLAVATGCVVLIPLVMISWGTLRSLTSVLQKNRLQIMGTLQECIWGLLYATMSAIAAWGLASFFFHRNQFPIIKTMGLACCVPGLCGALPLALVIASLFLTQAGDWLYGTPVPVLTGFVLYLFPRAVFLKLVFQKQNENDSLFLAHLLNQSDCPQQAANGGRLLWVTKGRPQYWAVAVLAFWVYWDVTISSILAPHSGMTSSVRLYGLMHYGQNSVLSAISLISFCIPVLLGIILFPVVRKIWIHFNNQSELSQFV